MEMEWTNMMKNRRKWGIIILIVLCACIGCATAADVTIKVNTVTASPNAKVEIPVMVTGATNLGGLDLTILYDPAVLKFTKASAGTLSKNGMIEKNETQPGTVLIGWVDTQGVNGGGEVIKLSFDVIGAKGTTSSIRLAVRGAYTTGLKDISYTSENGGVTVGEETKKTPMSTEIIVGALIIGILFVVRQRNMK